MTGTTALAGPLTGSSTKIDVKTFGAVGDGVVDDTEAIQEAETAAAQQGKQLVFDSGRYLVSKPIQVASNSVWKADPGTATLISATGNSLLTAIVVQNVDIDGLALEGATDPVGPVSPLLVAYKAAGLVFNDDAFEQTSGIGALLSNVNGSTVTNSTFTDIGNNPANPAKAAQAVAFSNDLAGFGNGNSVIGSTFSKIGLDSISSTGQHNFQAISNVINNFGLQSGWALLPAAPAGIYANYDDGFLAQNNTISSAQGNGIDVDNSGRALILRNTITGSGSAGVSLSSSSGVIVSGNSISDCNKAYSFVFSGGISIGDFPGFARSSNIVISSNVAGNDNQNPSQEFGIQILSGSSPENLVLTNDNVLDGNIKGPIYSPPLIISYQSAPPDHLIADLLYSITQTAAASLNAPAISISNLLNVATFDETAIAPFATTTIKADDTTANYTATVTLSTPANGSLTALALASYDNLTGVLTIEGSAAAVNAALQSVKFVPTPGQVAPTGQVTTDLRLSVDDGSGIPATGTVQVTATSSTKIDVKTFGAVGDGVVDDTEAIQEAETAAAQQGKQLVFDSGRYLVSKPIQVASNSVWKADPGTATLISATGNSLLTAIVVQNVDIDGLALEGATDPVGPVSPLLVAYKAAGLVFNDDAFEQTSGIGALLSNVNGSTVTNSTFTDIGNNPANPAKAAQAVAFSNDLAGFGNGNSVIGSTFSKIGLQAITATGQIAFSSQSSSIIEAPTLQGLAGQTSFQTSTTHAIAPFATTTIKADDTTANYTATVTLSTPANGSLTALALASYDNLTGVLTIEGSAAAVNAALQSVKFVPTPGQVAPTGQVTTDLRLSVDDGSGIPATGTVQVTATSSTKIDVKTFGAVGDGVVDDTEAIQEAETAAAQQGKQLVFDSGRYLVSKPIQVASNSVWKADPGTATLISATGNSLLTAIVVQNVDIDGLALEGATDPVGPVSPLLVAYKAAGLVFNDDAFEQTSGIGALLSNVNGSTVTNSTFTDIGNNPANPAKAAQAVAFSNDLAGFGNGNSVIGSTFSKIGLQAITATGQIAFSSQSSSIIEAPTLQGLAGQTSFQTSTTHAIAPFATTTIKADDTTANYTATVTLSTPANGSLTALALASYDNLTGVLTIEGSAAAVNAALQSVKFVPTPGQVAPTGQVTTDLRLSVDDGSGIPATGTVQVTATSSTKIDVKTFGAVGDGVVDDTEAIQEAETAAAQQGKQLVFDSGRYLVSKPIQVASNSVWKADPGTATLISATGNSLLTAIVVQNVDIDGLALEGATDPVGPVSPLLVAYKAAGLVFNDDAFEQTSGIGALLSNVNGSTVTNSTFTDIGNNPANPAKAAQAVAFSNDLAGFGNGNSVIGSTFSKIGLQAITATGQIAFSSQSSSIIEAPTLQGLAGQTSFQTSTTHAIAPFATTTIKADDTTANYTATVTLSTPANGSLTALALASYDNLTGVLTIEGSAAAVNAALQSVKFVPTPGQVAPTGQVTTDLRLSVDDGSGIPATGTVQVTATSSTKIDVKTFGAVGDGVVDDTEAIQEAETAAAQQGKQLVFDSGRYLVSKPIQVASNSVWKADPGTATLISATGNSLLTAIVVQNVDIDGLALEGATDPVGPVSPLLVAYKAAGLVFNDDAFEQTSGIGALLSNVNGSTVTNSTFTDIGNNPANPAKAAQAVAFSNDLAGFGNGNSVIGSTFSKIGLQAITATGQIAFSSQSSSIIEAPTLQGLAGQTSFQTSTTHAIAPFATTTIKADDTTANYTATVTLSTPANGSLTALALASYDNLTGVLTIEGSAAAVNAALQSVKFVPTPGQVAPTGQVTTDLRLSVDDGSGIPATGTVQVTATSSTKIDAGQSYILAVETSSFGSNHGISDDLMPTEAEIKMDITTTSGLNALLSDINTPAFSSFNVRINGNYTEYVDAHTSGFPTIGNLSQQPSYS